MSLERLRLLSRLPVYCHIRGGLRQAKKIPKITSMDHVHLAIVRGLECVHMSVVSQLFVSKFTPHFNIIEENRRNVSVEHPPRDPHREAESCNSHP